MKNIIYYIIIGLSSLFLISCFPDKYDMRFEVRNTTGETIFLETITDENRIDQVKTIHHGSAVRIKGLVNVGESGMKDFDLLFTAEPRITAIRCYTYNARNESKWWYLENADNEGRQFFNGKFWTFEKIHIHNSEYTGVWTFTIEPEDLEL